MTRRRLGTGIIALMIGGAALSGGCVQVGDSHAEREGTNDGWNVVDETAEEREEREAGGGENAGEGVDGEAGEEGGAPGGGGEVDRPAVEASCDEPYALRWEQPRQDPWGHAPTFIGWGPDDGMIVEANAFQSSETKIYRPDDGQGFSRFGERILGASGDFQRFVSFLPNPDRLLVRSAAEGTEIASWSIDSDDQILGAALSHDGTVAAAVLANQRDTVVRLRWWSVVDGAERGIAMLGYNTSHPALFYAFDLELEPDNRHALIVLPNQTDLHRIDLVSKVQTVWSDLHVDDAGIAREIVDVAISPDGLKVATTGGDGFLRLHAAALPYGDMRPLGEPIPVGVFETNANTYLPAGPVSPLAWSPDSRLLAFVDVDGRVRLLEDGELRPEALPVPTAAEERYTGVFGNSPDVPDLLAFSHDGLSLAVSYDRSVAVYGCGAAATVEDGGLWLDIVGPNVVSIDDSYDGEVSVSNGSPLVGLRVMVYDFPYNGIHAGNGVSFSTSTPGRYDLAVEAFDGRASGRATTTVEFTTD